MGKSQKTTEFLYKASLQNQKHFHNLDPVDLSNNKKFWKTIKPYFIHKGLNS